MEEKFCEICQTKIENDAKFHYLNNDNELKILDFLPEIYLSFTQKSVICNQCMTQIDGVQKFKPLEITIDKLLPFSIKEERGVEKIGVSDLQVIDDDLLINTDIPVCVENQTYYGCCTEEQLYTNSETHQNTTLFQCGVCSFRYVNPHVLSHQVSKTYHCEHCSFTTTTKTALRKHGNVHKEDKTFKCELCDFSTHWPSSLDLHAKLHLNVKKCEKCDYTSCNKTLFRSHVYRKHNKIKNHKCTECNHACRWPTSLKSHMRKHTGKKPFKCDKCDYKTNQKNNLRLHRWTHTGERPFKCLLCNYSATLKRSLIQHNEAHLKKPIRSCKKCDFKTLYRADMKKHKWMCNKV